MDKQRLTLTALTLLPLAVACGTQPGSGSSSVAAAGSSPVTGVHWTLDSLTVDGRTRQAPESAYLRIGEDGRVSGNAGCNSFGSTVTLKGDHVDFGDIQTTDMGCPKASMAFEESLSRTFTGGTFTSKVKGDELTLTTDDGDRVDLTKEQDAPSTAPGGTSRPSATPTWPTPSPPEPRRTSSSTRSRAPSAAASAATTCPQWPPSATDTSPSGLPRPHA